MGNNMSVRNELLQQVLTAYGGAFTGGESRNELLKLIALQIDSSADLPNTRNEILEAILELVGGTASDDNRNALMNAIVSTLGGVEAANRNGIIKSWIEVAGSVDTRWYMKFNGASFIELDSPINVRSSNGSSLEFMCVFPTFLVESFEILFGRVGSTSNVGYVAINPDGSLGSSMGDIMIDGVLSDEYPRDGKAHAVYIDVTASYKSTSSIATYNYDRFFIGMIWDIKFTNSDSGDWFIPLNEPFTEDHLVYDSNGNILGTKYNDVADDYTQTEPS